MAAYFFDIDGTVVDYHTNQWIDGAVDMLNRLHRQGHDVIFVTMRAKRDDGKAWSIRNTHILLEDLDFNPIVLFNIQSPRTMIDDSRVTAIRRSQNKKWEDVEL